jgi:hypothetical protein
MRGGIENKKLFKPIAKRAYYKTRLGLVEITGHDR